MAIKNFKSILDKTGYYVSEKDRKIFERGSLPAYFGRGMTDTIEFILYDQGDNILPQGKDGKMVRYVDISNKEAIRRYILIVRPQVSNKPNEYFVDVEKLINEAGYKNGIFKSQVTLLNKRVGSEKKTNKLWVHEISPSRTEIRVLPLKVDNKRLQNDLLTRYDIFLRDGEFRDDIVNRLQAFQSTLNAESVKKVLQNAYGEDWIKLVKSEFQVPDIDDFLRRVVEKSKEALNYFIQGKEFKIKSSRYGEPLPRRNLTAALDIMRLYKVSNQIVCDVIEDFLPKRNIIRKTQTSPIMLESRDKLGKILQQFTSNKTLDTKASVVAKVIKPRPVKKGRVTVKPPPPPPPKPVIIKTPPKVYYFYQCTGNGKVGRPSLSRFGKSIKPTSKGGGGGCYQMLSAFFSYEDMNGNTIKFNLKPGSSSKICALEGSVKVSGGGSFVKKELCRVKNYKPIIVKPKPYIPPPPPPPPKPIEIKPVPILNLPIKFPPLKLDWPPIKPFPPIKWPIMPGNLGQYSTLSEQLKKNRPIPKPAPKPTPPPPPIIPPAVRVQSEAVGIDPDAYLKSMRDRGFAMGGGGGMGTFGGYRKTSFGSGFSPFGSNTFNRY